MGALSRRTKRHFMDEYRKAMKTGSLFAALFMCVIAEVLTPPLLAIAEFNDRTEIKGEVSFRKDVLPILSERCFACHGFDAASREGGIRLDTFDGATGTGDSGRLQYPLARRMKAKLFAALRVPMKASDAPFASRQVS
jgi:hypothetical protein